MGLGMKAARYGGFTSGRAVPPKGIRTPDLRPDPERVAGNGSPPDPVGEAGDQGRHLSQALFQREVSGLEQV